MRKLKKILLVPDCHVPYQDTRAFNLMLKAGKVFRPDIIVTLGDFCDFYCVSSHSKDPNRKTQLSEELTECRDRLDDLAKLGARKRIFVAGNHEHRLERYLRDKAPELFDLYKVEDLLQLKQKGWDYVPYGDYTKIGKLHITHDCGKAGKTAHSSAESDFQSNIVIGHTHQFGYNVHGTATGKAHVSAMFGWLATPEVAIDYKHKIKAQRDYAHGFGVGYMAPNGNVYLTPCPIVNYTVVLEGRLLTG